MMNQSKLAGMVVTALGIIVTLIVVLADVLGLTDDPNTFDLDTFRQNQVLGTVVGIVILVAGLLIYFYGERFMGRGEPPANE